MQRKLGRRLLGKAAKQSWEDVLDQIEQIRPGFLAELEALKNTSGVMPVLFWWFTHPSTLLTF